MTSRWWPLPEKSDQTRISQGIDASRDKTGRSYGYDSLVPNHSNLSAGDSVVIREENEIMARGSSKTSPSLMRSE
jgi:hypothetical protein